MLETILRNGVRLLEPFGLVWICLVLLTMLLLWKKQRRFALATAALVVFIWVVGATPLAGSLLGSLESPWVGVKRADLPTADAIVLLGGFSTPSREEVGRLHFTGNADRAVVAMELVRLEKAKTLLIGGGAFTLNDESFSEADFFRDLIKERSLSAAEIISLGGCKHTRHEAEKVAALAQARGWKRILLVTSAFHLRRATAVFRTTTKLEIVPVPSAFLTSVSIVSPDSVDLIPRAAGFSKLDNYLHEQIGWWVYRQRGWISAEHAAQ